MSCYYLGVDMGSTKTHALVVDEAGQRLGFGEAGPGNHETVGYEGMRQAVQAAVSQALESARLELSQLSAAGFGVAGYDWLSERQPLFDVLYSLGFHMPLEIVNDAILGLLAGSPAGWGLAVVSGTGCNCWGWDLSRQHIGHVTGGGWSMGEYAGGSELTLKALQAVAYEWTRRGPATALSSLFVSHTGAKNPEDLLAGLMDDRYKLDAACAPLVFQAAAKGDQVAYELVRWAGRELGELAKCVIRQLGFEALAFDVVQVGSMWNGSPLLTEIARETIQAYAPSARLVRLTAPPVMGAVILAREVLKGTDGG